MTEMALKVVETPLGRFRKIGSGTDPGENWLLECPGCGTWAYMDDEQWRGLVSVDHATDGCTGGYHEQHDYLSALQAALEAER